VPALPISRRQALVAAVALGILLLLAGKLLLRAGAPGAARPVPRPARVSAAAEAGPRLVVDVVGAVRRPGLYRLRDGARVADAVARAGGSTAKADLEGINLAAPIVDGQQVVVPRKVAAGARPPVGEGLSAAGAAPTGPVSLSTATLEELDALPGVGPVTAQKILDYRTAHGAFHSVDELDAISGIGPARLDSLRDLVVP
jgi:competence protein ComEA